MTAYLKIDESIPRNMRIWRYMNLAKFISMLDQRALWLARADTFYDKHEGSLPEEMKRFIDKAYEVFKDKDKCPIGSTEDFQDYLVKNTFISCWHMNDDENMVMWEIYGQKNNSVVIQTTIERINNFVNKSPLPGFSLKLKKVQYKQPNEVNGIIRYEECSFIKCRHFYFEKEVRICLDTYFPQNSTKKTPLGYKLPADSNAKINLLIENVLVHPDSSDWFVEVVKSIVEKYGLRADDVRLGKCGKS